MERSRVGRCDSVRLFRARVSDKAGRAAPMEVQAEGWEVVVGELVVPGCLQDKRQGRPTSWPGLATVCLPA